MGSESRLPVEHRYWKIPAQLLKSLVEEVDDLNKEIMPIENIILLSLYHLENSSHAGIDRIRPHPLVDISRSEPSEHFRLIGFSTIHPFKGLENQVVINLDIDTVDGEK